MTLNAAIVTVSDSRSAGDNVDLTTPRLRDLLERSGFDVVRTELVPDDRETLRDLLMDVVDSDSPNLIITSGGTGLGPRDVTPEATEEVAERLVPGISEMVRAVSAQSHPHSLLSRAIAGTRGSTLIVNVPGSPGGALECTELVLPLVDHAVQMMRGGGHE